MADLDKELRKVKSKSAKLDALKESIRMRVIGIGWEHLSTPWSKNGKDYTPAQLTQHLKKIIAAEWTRIIPKKSPVKLPQGKKSSVLGTQASDAVAIDQAHQATTDEFVENAKKIRDDRDRYGGMQQTSAPAVDENLIGQHLEVCWV